MEWETGVGRVKLARVRACARVCKRGVDTRVWTTTRTPPPPSPINRPPPRGE